MVSAVDVAPARMGGILALADRSEVYRELASRLEDRQRVGVAEANAGARAFAWSALVAQNARTVALVAPSEDRARRWRAELAGWLGEERVLGFPERETMPFEASAPSGTAVHQRLLTLWRLATAQAPVAVVTSLRALLEHTIPPKDLARRGRTLRAADEQRARAELQRALVRLRVSEGRRSRVERRRPRGAPSGPRPPRIRARRVHRQDGDRGGAATCVGRSRPRDV